jgi:hypothetical protein
MNGGDTHTHTHTHTTTHTNYTHTRFSGRTGIDGADHMLHVALWRVAEYVIEDFIEYWYAECSEVKCSIHTVCSTHTLHCHTLAHRSHTLHFTQLTNLLIHTTKHFTLHTSHTHTLHFTLPYYTATPPTRSLALSQVRQGFRRPTVQQQRAADVRTRPRARGGCEWTHCVDQLCGEIHTLRAVTLAPGV